MDNSKVKDICGVMDTVLGCFKTEVTNGLMNVDTDDAMNAADIIKDLSESEKNCWEAEYYKLICKAMEESSEYDGPMGYNKIMRQKPYIDGYIHDPDFEQNMMHKRYTGDRPYGYSEDNEYGVSYDNYRTAKRHYTESKLKTDKDLMTVHGKEHTLKAIQTLKEIWTDADPTQRQEMKADLKAMIDGMIV